jgi:hypothetical protein
VYRRVRLLFYRKENGIPNWIHDWVMSSWAHERTWQYWGRNLLYKRSAHMCQLLWNVGQYLPDYTVLHPKRHPSSYSSPWEPHISPWISLSNISCLYEPNSTAANNKSRKKPTGNKWLYMRFEVFTAVRMMFFWVLAPCRLVGRCQTFRRNTLSPSLRLKCWRWRQYVSPKSLASTDESTRR